MKLIRLKLTDTQPFRSLQPGFEYHFRSDWELDEELKSDEDVSPSVCAGRNGSGKSNLLELLAAIFFQLEVLRVRRTFLPEAFFYDEETNPEGIPDGHGIPDAYELEYLIALPKEIPEMAKPWQVHIRVIKEPGKSPRIDILAEGVHGETLIEEAKSEDRDFFLPHYVVGYSSGENEILSLPFFKMRFIQYDEYWNALKTQERYQGRPDGRLAYLDNEFSQAILLCNLLYNDPVTAKAFHEDIGINELKEFRIILRRSVPMSERDITAFANATNGDNPSILQEPPDYDFRANLMHWLETADYTPSSNAPIVDRLKNCATCSFHDTTTDTLYLDYYVNDVTRQAFSDNFDFKVNQSPIALFQAFQVLLSLNLFSISDKLKADLYKSDSHYVTETVPTLASDERIMRFKFVQFTKEGVDEPVMLKSLSDGEHQLLHSLGLCLLFKNTNSLFLLDEPETHFNPEWRSSFISRLRKCFGDSKTHEMLITTHSPFLISDCEPNRVLLFKKEGGQVRISHPEYNTFGASVNQITMTTFGKRETIGDYANEKLERLRARFERGESKDEILNELNELLGDSVEKIMLVKTILDSQTGDR